MLAVRAAPTCQSLANQALLLILFALRSFQRFTVQVFLAQPRVAAQHGSAKSLEATSKHEAPSFRRQPWRKLVDQGSCIILFV